MVVNLSTLLLSQLSDEEDEAVKRLLAQLKRRQRSNVRQDEYYGARQIVRDLGIAIPPHLADLEAAIGWPATAVDALNERLRQDGWAMPDGSAELVEALGEIDETNHLLREFRVGTRLAMIHGVSFGVAGKGDVEADEPKVLVTVEPATRMTVTWDHRRKAVTEAVLVESSKPKSAPPAAVTLWLGDQVLELVRGKAGRWGIEERSVSVMKRPPIVRFVNRYGADRGGRSEITRPLRTLTDNAIRTIVAMEVSRDFHAAPKFWLLGADESQFVGPDGERRDAWAAYIGRLNAIPATEGSDGKPLVPTVEHFQGASPAPFSEQLRVLAQMVSAEAALPSSYLGLVHDANPTSADAALVDEARLNLRAEERCDDFGPDRGLLARFALWIATDKDPGASPRPVWRSVATPTLAAAADATSKLTGGKPVLRPDSEVTRRRLGLRKDEIEILEAEDRAQPPITPPTPPAPPAPVPVVDN